MSKEEALLDALVSATDMTRDEIVAKLIEAKGDLEWASVPIDVAIAILEENVTQASLRGIFADAALELMNLARIGKGPITRDPSALA